MTDETPEPATIWVDLDTVTLKEIDTALDAGAPIRWEGGVRNARGALISEYVLAAQRQTRAQRESAVHEAKMAEWQAEVQTVRAYRADQEHTLGRLDFDDTVRA